MTRTQIDCFKAVRSTLSFSKAANSMYISQPAISKNISKLESELGFALFVRNGTSLEVTQAGEIFYEYIDSTDAAFFKMMEAVRKLGGTPGTVNIGCPETWDISSIMDAFAGAENIQVETCKLSELVDKLSSGKLDAVISHDFYSPSLPGLTTRDITDTGTGIIYSKEHFGDVKSIKAFSDTNFIIFDRDIEKRFTTIIRKICSSYGFVPLLSHCDQLPIALYEVRKGSSVMLFTDWDSISANSNYGYFKLKDRFPIKIVYSADDASKDTLDVVDKLLAHKWHTKQK